MPTTILLTSFQTWLPHQVSNASDDLLELLLAPAPAGVTLRCLRRLPVETAAASHLTIGAIQACQPDWVLCCGMAETRSHLSLETNARCGDRQLFAPLDVPALVGQLTRAQISHDAGRFVCEGLYFAVLDYLQQQASASRGLFVHVPVLTAENQAEILADMQGLLSAIALQPVAA